MTDPQIPASKPVAVLPAQTQGSSVSGTAPARLQISNAAVKQAPPSLQNPPQPVHIEGRVISSNPQAQELKIATPSGEVTVQSSANLPPDTLVAVDLSMQKGAEVATITILRQQAQVSQALEEIVPEPAAQPPLQAGDVVQAIYVPEPQDSAPPLQTNAAPPVVSPPDLSEVAQIIQNFPVSGLPKLPGPLPATPQLLAQIATAPNVLAALQKLSPDQQANISAYLARPDVGEVLKKVLPAAARLQLARPALVRTDAPAAPPEPPQSEEPIDDNLLQIVKVQTGARMSQEVLPPESRAGNTTQQPALALLQGLLPLLETLQPEESPLGAQQMMPGMGTQGTPLAELMPKSLFEVTVISVTPPGDPALTPQAGELQGKVETISPSGFPVVRVGNDLFVLKTLSAAAIGSTLTFSAAALTAEQAIASGKPLATAAEWFHPLLSDNWPALQEALQAVSTAAPMLADALRDTIPTATPRLVPTALFFLAALRVGSVESWLGEPVLQTLRQAGKSSLIDRLTSDFGKIAAQAKEMVAGDWRAISMPLRHDENISQLQFFVRQQQDEKGGNKDDEASARPITRFVLNLRLSRLGDMQLDGLLHQQRFDLILRSAAALSFPMRQDLMQGFQRGLAQAGMAGGISFQIKAEQWVNIALPHQGTTA